MDQTLLLLFSPLIVLELAMKIVALLSLRKQARTRGPKIMWVLVILLVNTIGWILYFFVGREEP